MIKAERTVSGSERNMYIEHMHGICFLLPTDIFRVDLLLPLSAAILELNNFAQSLSVINLNLKFKFCAKASFSLLLIILGLGSKVYPDLSAE